MPDYLATASNCLSEERAIVSMAWGWWWINFILIISYSVSVETAKADWGSSIWCSLSTTKGAGEGLMKPRGFFSCLETEFLGVSL